MADHILLPKDFGLKIYNRFPPQYRVDDEQTNFALRRYLEAAGDGGFSHSIEELNGILDFANADTVDAKVIPYLFQQYGIDLFYGIPEQFLRYFLPRLGEAWSKKGSLSVVEFVVSSLAGVKSETVIKEYPNGDIDLGVNLIMDISLSEFFPDTKQFGRILKKFLPFYVDSRLVYVFSFDDSPIFDAEDSRFDRVIIGKKIITDDMLNTDRALDKDFILNYSSGFEASLLRSLDTHRFNILTLYDITGKLISNAETIKDTVRVDYGNDNSRILSKEHVFNRSRILYKDTPKLKALDPETISVVISPVEDSASIGNKDEPFDSVCDVSGDESFLFTYDDLEKESILRTEHGVCELFTEDSESVFVQVDDKEDPAVLFSIFDTEGMFLNSRSVLNIMRLNIPSAIDLVTVNGITSPIYPDCIPV